MSDAESVWLRVCLCCVSSVCGIPNPNLLCGEMGSIGVLLVAQVIPYLEQELDKRYKLFRAYDQPQTAQVLSQHASSIRAVVGNSNAGADAELIEALPKLEIVSSFSVGVDRIDLDRCKEKGIRVTNTPDVLTDEVADLAIGLMLALLRRICECDRYVRSGKWKKGDYKLTTKVRSFLHSHNSECCVLFFIWYREFAPALSKGKVNNTNSSW